MTLLEPRTRMTPETLGRGGDRSESLCGVKILLADPNAGLLDCYRRSLTDGGAVVVAVNDGLECLTQLRDFCPDVLVLEPELPGGGADVLERMLWGCEAPVAPVLALTAGTDLEQLRRILKLPLFDLAIKPLSPEQLASKIRWVVDTAHDVGKIGWPRLDNSHAHRPG